MSLHVLHLSWDVGKAGMEVLRSSQESPKPLSSSKTLPKTSARVAVTHTASSPIDKLHISQWRKSFKKELVVPRSVLYQPTTQVHTGLQVAHLQQMHCSALL